MPDVVGRDLQWAQDTLQAAGIYLSDSFDASGQGRNQILDSNWVVVEQSPAPGAAVDDETFVEFGSLKWGEDGQPAEPAYYGTIPNLVCADLQYAEDTLQAHGYPAIESRDATADGDAPIGDRGYIVIEQDPPGGTADHEPGRRVVLVAAPADRVEGCG